MTPVISILSIQSSVAYGHVGNSAATFPLMRMGVEVWPVITVHFSNHTGYGAWRGPMLSGADVSEVVRGIDERGVLGRCDAVLSGYQGAADVGSAVLETVALVKSRNPEAIYCCDPVLGDVGRGFFVRPGIPEFMRDQVVPAAQVVTPNQFELEYLSGRQTSTVEDVLAAADVVRTSGPDTVLVTSVVHEGAAPDTLAMIAVTGQGAWSVTTPLLHRPFQGAGDLTAAVFLANLLLSADVARALGRTAAVVYGVLRTTIDSGEAELQLVAGQAEIAEPSTAFEVTQLR
jgi:pyridoxine kinase